MIASAVQAVGLFLVTNIDDIIVLSLFFARGAGQRRTTSKIVAGQYLGFGGILLASLAVTVTRRRVCRRQGGAGPAVAAPVSGRASLGR